MTEHKVGIIMNGVTGRMGMNQHLIRSILAIRAQGGIKVNESDVIMPCPVLTGRNADKLRALAQMHGGLPWSTSVQDLLADESLTVYFDAQTTDRRVDAVSEAIAAGKHIYCEKPTATDSHSALRLFEQAKAAGVKHGVVQDKLWLPGLLNLKLLLESGYFGHVLEVRGEFGYWVFTGEHQLPQRPSWNYRREDGGGIIIDMFCHWRYVIDNLFGSVASVSCLGATHIAKRWDENRKPYRATAEDAAYATFLTEEGVICQFNSSWCTRVRRDDLLTIQVDGTDGSAVAGLRACRVQSAACTPKPVWNPDVDTSVDLSSCWSEMPSNQIYDNAFKAQWELFLRHIVLDEPFAWGLLEGAKGVQLAELGLQSWRERRWIDVPDL